jgi:hypothetical protein
MPRKNRGPALILVLALLVGLVGQVAVASPLGSRSAIAESSAGALAAVWGWLTERWSNLGQALTTPAQPPNRVWEKTSGGSDPNNGPKLVTPVVPQGN